MPKANKQHEVVPTYQELADLLAELTVVNIANLDSADGRHRFVSCFTYGTGHIPSYWQRAIDAREALIKHRVVERRSREK